MMSHIVELLVVDVGEAPIVVVSEVPGIPVVSTVKDYLFLLIGFG
jgi:hypothetical protein